MAPCQGADIGALNGRNKDALFIASEQGYLEIVSLLLERGPHQNQRESKERFTPLIGASFAGHMEVARGLLDYGAELHAVCITGENALFWAVFEGHLQLVAFLIERGLDVRECRNTRQGTALMAATIAGNAMVEFLLKNGGLEIIDATDSFGRTALRLCCRDDRPHYLPSVARLLLDVGADPRIATNSEETPLQAARRCNRQEVIPMLEVRNKNKNRSLCLSLFPVYRDPRLINHSHVDRLL